MKSQSLFSQSLKSAVADLGINMEQYHLRAYAHIGDAVYEVFIREKVIEKTSNSKKMHDLTTKHVKAEFQGEVLDKISGILSDEEKDIVRRARNMPSTTFRRANQSLHRHATALEALIGFNYMHDKNRYNELLQAISEFVEV